MCTLLLLTRFARTPSAPWQGELVFFIYDLHRSGGGGCVVLLCRSGVASLRICSRKSLVPVLQPV